MIELKPTHFLQKLQALRIPAGWTLGWNTFLAQEIPEDGFGGDSLLYFLRHDRRLVIDVEWRPEDDPNGHYNYYVERQPLRTDEEGDYVRIDHGQSRSRDEVVAWVNGWLERGLDDSPCGTDLKKVGGGLLLPLRLSSGWTIERNAIKETPLQPPERNVLLFRAIEEQRRFRIDVVWQPDGYPAGEYLLEVRYAPWPRTEKGKRRTDVPLQFDEHARVMHRFSRHVLAELVAYLEAWLWRASCWAVEGH